MTRPGRLFGSRCLRRTRRDGHTAQASPVLSDCTDQPALRVIAAQEGTASGRSERRECAPRSGRVLTAQRDAEHPPRDADRRLPVRPGDRPWSRAGPGAPTVPSAAQQLASACFLPYRPVPRSWHLPPGRQGYHDQSGNTVVRAVLVTGDRFRETPAGIRQGLVVLGTGRWVACVLIVLCCS